MHTRTAREDDAEIVGDMVMGLLMEIAPGIDRDRNAVAQTARRLLRNGAITAILAFEGEAPVGVITLDACTAIYANGAFGEISELYVVPSSRSRGVAAMLLDAAKRIAHERGWTRLEVGAPAQPEWSRTKAFYMREGFVEVGPRLKLLFA